VVSRDILNLLYALGSSHTIAFNVELPVGVVGTNKTEKK
jgi:hypothetical protein